MNSLSVLILTLNEEANIGRTIQALPEVEEVLVVDSGSSDRTLSIAADSSKNLRVVTRAFDSHTAQWNFGLDQVKTEWVLTLDADYELSKELRAEIMALHPSGDVSGYFADFVYRIYGHSLRASSYPPRVVLFRTSHGRYVDDGHTQTLWIYSASRELRPPSASAGTKTLSGKIYHDDRKSLSDWLQAQDRYAILEARHLLEIGKSGKSESGRNAGEGAARLSNAPSLSVQDRLRLKIFFAAPAMFFYLFFWRGLILDGWPGWFYVAQRTLAELLLSVRLLIEKYGLGDEKAIR